MSELANRLAMSAACIGLTGAILYYSEMPLIKPLVILLTAVLLALTLCEYYHMAARKGTHPLTAVGVITTLLYVPLQIYRPDLLLPLFILLLFALFATRAKLTSLAVTLFGLFYVTVPLTYLLQINYTFGAVFVFYLLLVTKITDSAAYAFGKQFGKRPLAAAISPKKTWEGAIGGLLSAIAVSLVTAHFLPVLQLTIQEALLLGAALSVAGQAGDLAESLLKRDAGIKDSGTTPIPGFGGLLDLLDSLIFTAPLAFLFLTFKGTSP